MHQNNPIKTHFQLFFILFITAAVLIGLSLVVGTGVQPQWVAAQEPLASPSPAVNTFSLETLEAYGISPEAIVNAFFDLQVAVKPNVSSIPTTGGQVTFTVFITNSAASVNTAQLIKFSHNLPAGMTGGTPNFGSLTAFSDNLNPPTWLIVNDPPLAKGSAIQITVVGTLSSVCNSTATYQANVYPYDTRSDTNLANNVASASVNLTGGKFCSYLPLVRRDPTPTPNPIVFFDDFSDDDWSTADDNNCSRDYKNGEYEIKAKTDDKNCFSPAPDDAEREHGTFKVKVRRESGSSDFTVAIYANGEGGDTYYALEVDPDDDCDWKLIRLKDDDSKTLRSGDCASAINRDSGSNILELRHFSNGNISAFINGTQLGTTYNDSSDLGGEGTGVYVRTNKDDDVTVRFDDFTVIRP